MLEQVLRTPYQRLFVDHFASIIRYNVTPIQVTCFGALIGVFTLPALAYQHNYLAILFLLISGYCDTLDGTIARIRQTCSAWGSVLDIMADRGVEFAVILGLWMINPFERSFLCIMLLGSIFLCVTSFLVVGIFTPNHSDKNFYYSPGLIERPEAFLFFIFMILIPSYFILLSIVLIVLIFITTFIRIYEFSQSDFAR